VRTVHELREVKGEGIVGLGLGGAEKEFPPKDFVRAFDLARESGFRLTVHAGEAAGNESIRGAVELLKAEAIGHGTHLTDQALLERIGEAGIGIELCPISNLRTKSIAAMGDHPVRSFFDAGLLISVSTDDPAMFGNSLADEFEALAETHRFTEAEILEVMRRTAASSFMPPEKKAAYAERLSAL
jgi:adenosine deaminase